MYILFFFVNNLCNIITAINFILYIFVANQADSEIELDEQVSAATCHVLPHTEFDMLWESLIYVSIHYSEFKDSYTCKALCY